MAVSQYHRARHDTLIGRVTLCKMTFEGNIRRDASGDLQDVRDILEGDPQININQVGVLRQSAVNIQNIITANNLTANGTFAVVNNDNTTQTTELTIRANSFRNYGWGWKFIALFSTMESRWKTRGCEVDTFIINKNKQLEIDIQNFQTNVTSAQSYLTKTIALLDQVIQSGNITPQNIERLNDYMLQFNSILALQNVF